MCDDPRVRIVPILRRALARLLGLGTGGRRDRELADEIESHLQFEIDDGLRAGLSPTEARRRALLRAGGVAAAREAYRDQASVPVVDRMLQTLRHAWRSLRRSPGYAAAVIVSLALGVGATTAMFTLIDGVLRRPLPYPEAASLLTVGLTGPTGTRWELFDQDLDAWREGARTLESVAVVGGYAAVVAGEALPEWAEGASASANLLQVLGLTPVLGKWFAPEEARPGAARVVVLGHELWQRQFAGDPGVVGRALRIYGDPWTVIGVLPPVAGFPPQAQFWLPGGRRGQVVARAASGATPELIAQELVRLSPSVANVRRAGRAVDVVVMPLQEQVYGSVAPAVRSLFGATVLLLLIACANVANLSLARALGRRREWAVRASLGAGRRTLASLVIAENLLVAAAGGLCGVVAAYWTSQAFVSLMPAEITLPGTIGVNGAAILFGCAASLAAALVASVGPAFAVAGAGGHHGLAPDGFRAGRSPASRRVRYALVAVQLAAALVLLTGAGLLLRSVARLTALDLGFNPRGVVIATVNLIGERYRDEARVRRLFEDLGEQARRLPGVESVAFGPAPLVGGHAEGLRDGFNLIYTLARPDGTEAPRPVMWVKYIDVGYLDTFGVRLRAGRGIQETDNGAAPAVALVKARAAALLFPGGRAVGELVPNAPKTLSGGRPITVVGVVEDARQRDVALQAEPEMFVPAAQQRLTMSAATIALRTSADPESLMRPLRQALSSLDPELATTTLTTMAGVVEASLARHRFLLLLLGAFAGLALALAAFGLYAVVSYLVAQRTPEIGLRMALGAGRAQVAGLVAREVTMLVGAGVAAGGTSAFLLSGILASFLYDVTPHDAAVFAGAPLVLAAAACAAAAVPTRRALRIDPACVLRAE